MEWKYEMLWQTCPKAPEDLTVVLQDGIKSSHFHLSTYDVSQYLFELSRRGNSNEYLNTPF